MIDSNIITNRLKEIIQKVENGRVSAVIPMMQDLEDLIRCDDPNHNHKD